MSRTPAGDRAAALGAASPIGRVRAALPLLAAVYVPAGLVLLAARLQPWVVPSSLVAPLRFAGRESWYEGLFTAVEVLLWASAAVAAGVAARRSRPGGRSRLLAGGAGVSVVLLLDDLFQLHKPVLPRHLGVPSAAVLLAEAGLVALLLVSQRRAIAASPRPAVLGVSVAFFALWVSVKALPGFGGTTVLQAGAKFAGVAGWAAFWLDTALDTARRAAPRGSRGTPREPARHPVRGGLPPWRSETTTQSSIDDPTADAEAGAGRQGDRHGRQHQRSTGGPR